MCGRAAQTQHCVATAARNLGIAVSEDDFTRPTSASNEATGDEAQSPSHHHRHPQQRFHSYEWRDNFNLSPGMDAMVFFKDSRGKLCMDRKVWGIITHRGTPAHPLPLGMGKHFESLMFNARADTLYQKPTFGRLATSGRSCLIALDGFFEWKAGPGGKHKQPYFVHRQQEQTNSEAVGDKDSPSSNTARPYLLMAGLWNQVPTGREDAPTLDTFTIITTEVCQPIQWLHSRMPVCIWDEKLALDWLTQPTEKTHRLIDQAAQNTAPGILEAYPVTTSMSSTKFRSADAIKRLPSQPSIKDLFAQMKATATTQRNKDGDVPSKPIKQSWNALGSELANQSKVSLKRRAAKPSSSPASGKRTKISASPKKKLPPVKNNTKIDSFFKPKK